MGDGLSVSLRLPAPLRGELKNRAGFSARAVLGLAYFCS